MHLIRVFFEKVKDLFMFHEGGTLDNYIVPPTVTAGSILWGILLRSAIIIIVTMFVVISLEQRELWWFAVFAFWIGVVYPAFRQWNKFQSRIKELRSDTLCGKCRYFVAESQLCSIYDEHIGNMNLPCNGES